MKVFNPNHFLRHISMPTLREFTEAQKLSSWLKMDWEEKRKSLHVTLALQAIGIFKMLPMMPRFTIERVRQQLDTTFCTATAAVRVLEDLGIVMAITGQKKNRCCSYQAYVELLSRWQVPVSLRIPVQTGH